MGFVDRLKGKTAAKVAKEAGEIQSQAAKEAAGNVSAVGQQVADSIYSSGQQASALLDPYSALGAQGLEQSSFLTDPQAQFDFLQSNPLFQMGLDNANTQTNQMAAARGRLSAGDTLQQLNNNALLTAAPLIQQQKQSIGDLLTMGQNIASSQGGILQNTALNQGSVLQNTAANRGNLLTGAAAAQAGGMIGAENARAAGMNNVMDLAGKIGGSIFSAASGGADAGASGGSPSFLANLFGGQ